MDEAAAPATDRLLIPAALSLVLHAALFYCLSPPATITAQPPRAPRLEMRVIENAVPPSAPQPTPPPRDLRSATSPVPRVAPAPAGDPAVLPAPVAVPEVPTIPAPPSPAGRLEPSSAQRPPPAAPSRTSAVVDASACARPEYPPAALRAEEAGVVALSFLVGVDGTALDSRVERSSGHRRLDEAARRALALCRFRPATVDGNPVQAWARIEYEWRIE